MSTGQLEIADVASQPAKSQRSQVMPHKSTLAMHDEQLSFAWEAQVFNMQYHLCWIGVDAKCPTSSNSPLL